jgi:hypothetical protein
MALNEWVGSLVAVLVQFMIERRRPRSVSPRPDRVHALVISELLYRLNVSWRSWSRAD